MHGQQFVECVFFHRPSSTAIITDLLFWVDPKQTKGLLYRKMLKAIHIHDKSCGCLDDLRKDTIAAGLQAQCNTAARELLELRPSRLCLTHGAPTVADTDERLRRGLAWTGPLPTSGLP